MSDTQQQPPPPERPQQQHQQPIRVLLVEDNPADARLLTESLKDAGRDAFRITHVSRLSAAVEALAKEPPEADVIALDLSLPDSAGLATVQRVQAVAPGVPIVVLTGLQDEALALQAVRQGVQDYLVKGQCEGGLAARALRYAVERQRVESAYHESEQRYRALTTATADVMYRMSPDWAEMRQLTGRGFIADTSEPSRDWVEQYIHPDDRPMVLETIDQAIRSKSVFELEHRVVRADGTLGWTHSRAIPILDARGEITEWFGAASDVTQRKVAEEALRENEARLASLFEALPVGVGIIGAGGKLIASNREMEAYLPTGIVPSQDEARIDRWRATLADGRPLEPSEYPGARAMRGERVVPGVEFRYRRDDGTEVWTQVAAVPMRAADGGVGGTVVVINDIDALKRTEEELRRAHQFSEGLIETARSIVLLLDTKGRILRFNPYFETLTGRRLEDVRGKSWFDTFLPERDRERIRALFGRALTAERTSGNVNPIVTKDGRERDIEWFDAPLTDARGELIGVLCTGQDITDRKAAEERLREGLARLAAVVSTAVDAIITIDEQGIMDSVNPSTERLFGYTAAELLGRNVRMLMPEPYAHEHDGYLRAYLKTGVAKIIGIGREVVGLRKDGTTFPLDLSVSEFRAGGRRMFTGILHDLSNRRRLEREILEASAQEQRRIGHDLHDGICQQILGASFGLEVHAQRLEKAASDQVPAVRKLLDLLNDTLTQARALSHGLNPIDLRAGGLPKALHDLTGRVSEMFKIDCEFREEGEVHVPDNTTATHLLRIAQEAISNAIKHGRARHIAVALVESNGHLTLTVTDDGRGLPPAPGKTGGRGTQIMQYRAGMIGGTLAVRPADNGGVLVTCSLRLPVSSAPRPDAGAASKQRPPAPARGHKPAKPSRRR